MGETIARNGIVTFDLKKEFLQSSEKDFRMKPLYGWDCILYLPIFIRFWFHFLFPLKNVMMGQYPYHHMDLCVAHQKYCNDETLQNLFY